MLIKHTEIHRTDVKWLENEVNILLPEFFLSDKIHVMGNKYPCKGAIPVKSILPHSVKGLGIQEGQLLLTEW